MDIVTKARLFATEKHAEVRQVRKYSGKPYIVHPAKVVQILKQVTTDPNTLAAAWLHDTVEDTNTTIDEIYKEFGTIVGSLVGMLTDVSKPEDGNRAVRKAIDRAHTAKASPTAKTIKLADLIDNSLDIMYWDEKFAEVYMAEKELLLEVLTEGNNVLWERANHIIEQYYLNQKGP